MVGTEEAKVFGPVIPCISVDMIDVNRDAPGMRITFVPSAHAALFAIRCDHVRSYVTGGLVKARCRAVDLTRKPAADILFVVKGCATLVRAVDERVSADKIIAAAPPTSNNLLRRHSHGSNDNG